MLSEVHLRRQLRDIVRASDSGLRPGDSLAHELLNECIRRGWARRLSGGSVVATAAGRDADAMMSDDAMEVRQ